MAGVSTANEKATELQLLAIIANQLIDSYGKVLHYDKGWPILPQKKVESIGSFKGKRNRSAFCR